MGSMFGSLYACFDYLSACALYAKKKKFTRLFKKFFQKLVEVQFERILICLIFLSIYKISIISIILLTFIIV